MEPAGVSGTVTIFQIRGHTIRSKLYAEKNPTEIHGELSEVSGEFTVDLCMVSHWQSSSNISIPYFDQ